MPNWAYNTLTVYGPKADVLAFKADITNEAGGVDLTALVPMPRILQGSISPAPTWTNIAWAVRGFREGTVDAARLAEEGVRILEQIEKTHACEEQTGFSSWYEWCIGNWGTKWPPSDYNVSDPVEVDDKLSWDMSFDTPWCSPVTLFDKISVLYPSLLFIIRATEESHEFTGAFGWQNGEFVDKTYCIWDEVPTKARKLQSAMKAVQPEGYDEDCYSALWDKQHELDELVCELAQEEVLYELGTRIDGSDKVDL